jgi:hypothetical protein
MRLVLVVWVLLALVRPGGAQPVLPQSDMRAGLNHSLTDWWLVRLATRGGATWRNLVSGNHATLTAMAVPSTATSGWQMATSRRAGVGEVTTDGVNDAVTIPATVGQGSAFTVALWLKTTTATGAAWIIAKGNSSQYAWSLGTATGDATNLQLRTHDCAGGINRFQGTSSGGSVNNGAWHHIVVVYIDGTRADIYFDRALIMTSTTFTAGTYCAASTSVVTLGMRGDAAAPFAGTFDDVRVWSRPLTAIEVARLYVDSVTGYHSTLLPLPGPAPAPSAGVPAARPWIAVY